VVDSSHCQYFQQFQKKSAYRMQIVEIRLSLLMVSKEIFEFHISRIRRPISANMFPLIDSLKQASWRPQRHNYSNKRIPTIAQHQEKHMSSTWLATSHRQKLA
jgi:hypothetical protein